MKRGRCLPTLEYGSILDDETLELRTDHLQAGLHVAARRHQVALLHLLGAAGRAFGLANLQVGAWREGRERRGVSAREREGPGDVHAFIIKLKAVKFSQRLCGFQNKTAAKLESFFHAALFQERDQPGQILPLLQTHNYKTELCSGGW